MLQARKLWIKHGLDPDQEAVTDKLLFLVAQLLDDLDSAAQECADMKGQLSKLRAENAALQHSLDQEIQLY